MLRERRGAQKATWCLVLFMWDFEKRQSCGDRKQMRLLGTGDRNKAQLWQRTREGWWSCRKWIVVLVAQPCRCTKNNCDVHLHWWIPRHLNYVSVKLYVVCAWGRRGEDWEEQEEAEHPVQPPGRHQTYICNHHTQLHSPKNYLWRITISDFFLKVNSFKFEATNSNSEATSHLPSRACVPWAK